MSVRLHRLREEREGGFTLVELLIVIIIIGILASIAIPIFLNQRNKAYDAAAKSDLKGMQVAEESYLSDFSTYTTAVTGTTSLTSEGFKPSSSTTNTVVGIVGGSSWCVKSVSQTGTSYYLGNNSGGPTTTACTNS
jgi:type IV pilus assembly protein PilA